MMNSPYKSPRKSPLSMRPKSPTLSQNNSLLDDNNINEEVKVITSPKYASPSKDWKMNLPASISSLETETEVTKPGIKRVLRKKPALIREKMTVKNLLKANSFELRQKEYKLRNNIFDLLRKYKIRRRYTDLLLLSSLITKQCLYGFEYPYDVSQEIEKALEALERNLQEED